MMPIVLLIFISIACLFNRLDPGHAKKFDREHRHWIEKNFGPPKPEKESRPEKGLPEKAPSEKEERSLVPVAERDWSGGPR